MYWRIPLSTLMFAMTVLATWETAVVPFCPRLDGQVVAVDGGHFQDLGIDLNEELGAVVREHAGVDHRQRRGGIVDRG